MKKVNLIKKKLTAFGLAICTLLTSVGVNKCEAMNNQVQQGQQGKDNKSSWTVGDVVKGTIELAVLLGLLYADYKVGALTFISNDTKTAGNIFVGLTSLMGTAFSLVGALSFMETICALLGEAKKKNEGKLKKMKKEIAEAIENVKEGCKENYTESNLCAAIKAIDVLTYVPRKIVMLLLKGLYKLSTTSIKKTVAYCGY